MPIYIFIPCFVHQIYPNVGLNMVRVLEELGFSILPQSLPLCCGQASHNAGFKGETEKTLRSFFKAYPRDSTPIVVPSASCAGFLKTGAMELFPKEKAHFANRIFEFSHFLHEYATLENHHFAYPFRVMYHRSCASRHAYPVEHCMDYVLSRIEGLELVPLPNPRECCGFGGSFSIKFGSISASMAQEKLATLADLGTQKILSTDLSCLLHLSTYATKQNTPLEPVHITDMLTFDTK